MTSKEIYSQTKKFPRRLLMLNIACVVGSLLLGAIICGIAMLTKSGGLLFGGFMIALVVYSVSSNIVEHYIGYMFKYGAVHAIATAWATGQVADSYFNDSVEYIKNGFLKANIYMVLDKLIHAAVRGVTKLVNFITGFLPKNIQNFMETFINMYLDYIDECCLAYSMLHADQNVAKSSCDGIVLYYQNGKNMLAPAFKTSIRIVLTKGAVVLTASLLLAWWPLALAWCLFGMAIVVPFLNHRVLCNTIVAYLDCVQNCEVQHDLYEKLSKVKAFQKLREKVGDPDYDPAPGNSKEVVRAMKNNTDAPKPVSDVIPEPPQPKVSQEEMMWQQAWNRMSDKQRQMYRDMSEDQRLSWKRQILKSLFNYDMP